MYKEYTKNGTQPKVNKDGMTKAIYKINGYRDKVTKVMSDKSFVINGQWLANLKSKVDDSSIDSSIWGAELSDGSYDYNANETIFQIAKMYNKDRVEILRLFNNGMPLNLDDLENRFLKFPVTPFKYKPGTIGCKGGGTKLTGFRVGVFDKIWSYHNNEPYLVELTLCSDEDGQKVIDFNSDDFTKQNYLNLVNSIRVNTNFIDQEELPQEMKNNSKGIGYEMRWFKNADVQFDKNKLFKWLSIRYGQLNNFKVFFEDKTQDEKKVREILPKTHFRMFENKNPVYQYTDLTLDKNPIEVQGVEFDFYYGCRIAPKLDRKTNEELENRTKSENRIESLKTSVRGDVPLIIHLSNSDIVTFIDNLGSSQYDTDTSWMLYCVRPRVEINGKYAVNKSSGYSDESFGKELKEGVRNKISELKLKNKYENAEKKQENNEVKQFFDYITHPNSTEIRKDIRSLTNIDVKTLANKKNWTLFKRDKSDREVDIRNNKGRIAIEFQASDKVSDTTHLDKIASQINLAGRGDAPYDYYGWVAKKHIHRNELIKLLQGLDWENNHMKTVILFEFNQVMDSFDADDIETISIDDEVKTNKFF